MLQLHDAREAILEPAKRVELDFAGVPEIGQAFADERFRVSAAARPPGSPA